MSTGTKDPRFVESGLRGARKRWADHEPRTVRLDSLDSRVRDAVLMLIRADEAARRFEPDEKGATATNGDAQEAESDRSHHHQQAV